MRYSTAGRKVESPLDGRFFWRLRRNRNKWNYYRLYFSIGTTTNSMVVVFLTKNRRERWIYCWIYKNGKSPIQGKFLIPRKNRLDAYHAKYSDRKVKFPLNGNFLYWGGIPNLSGNFLFYAGFLFSEWGKEYRWRFFKFNLPLAPLSL
jgi:hypothetical protein